MNIIRKIKEARARRNYVPARYANFEISVFVPEGMTPGEEEVWAETMFESISSLALGGRCNHGARECALGGGTYYFETWSTPGQEDSDQALARKAREAGA